MVRGPWSYRDQGERESPPLGGLTFELGVGGLVGMHLAWRQRRQEDSRGEEEGREKEREEMVTEDNVSDSI